ncbi:MAG TPA: alkaline phosphatase D family protein [Candidatus Kapabacteria bacterium]|nr:alkaline phosphatase D family protein [Candidatus Kapabacteria bacterium]
MQRPCRFHVPFLFLLLLPMMLRAQGLHRHPVVGAVTDNSAIIAVWLNGGGAVRIAYGADSAGTGGQLSDPARPAAGANGALKIALANLLPSTRYYYVVVDSTGTPISPRQSFATFPTAGTDAPVSLLFGSCQQNRATDSGRVFTIGRALGGNVFLQLGDWGYPDARIAGYPDAAGTIEASYELRLDTTYRFASDILSRMPVAYEWDDHDYAGDNSNGSNAGLRDSLLAAYDRHIPHYPLANPAEGIWHSFRLGNVEVFMIDDRSQRRPADSAFNGNTFAPKPGHSMLAGYPVSGTDQRTWLLDALRRSTARWKIIVSQVVFNPALAPAIQLSLLAGRRDAALQFADKWIGYPEDIDSIRTLINAGYLRNTLVVSGDAHTNVYDDGTHSLIPEFMAANLDHDSSAVFQQLKALGFNVWTGYEESGSRTIGHIVVETTPRHRLIVESFDTSGTRQLIYSMVDSSSGVETPAGSAEAWRIESVRVQGSMVRIGMVNAPDVQARVEIYDVMGRLMADRIETTAAGGELQPAIGGLPAGVYFGRIRMAHQVRVVRFTTRGAG